MLHQLLGRTVGALALALLAFLVPQTPAAHAENGATLRIGIGEDPDVLDPARQRLFASGLVLRSLCDGLFTIDAAGNISRNWRPATPGRTTAAP